MKLSKNEEMILKVAKELPATLLKQVVFVGGSIVSLLITDEAASDVRVTQDVDMVVDVAGRIEFYRLENQLREAGFEQVIEEDAPICRWRINTIKVDIMPCDQDILGFSNKWYNETINNATKMILECIEIRLASAPYFLATKVEAFLGRGNNDFMGSSDMEDIITIIDGRAEIIQEIKTTETDLQQYLHKVFQDWLKQGNFINALPGLLPPDLASQERLPIIVERIKAI